LRMYGATELLIGISAILMPLELSWGHSLLQRINGTRVTAVKVGCRVLSHRLPYFATPCKTACESRV
jgi:hypothetical protein